MKDKYFSIDLLIIIFLSVWLILTIIRNDYSFYFGIAGYGIFLIRAIIGLINSRNKT